MIHWIEWQFWSWKSSLATHIARKVAQITAKGIAKWLSASWNIILSNIKMNEETIGNYFYFEDDKFLEILRTANAINDLERALYWFTKRGNTLTRRKRNKFSRIYIFFDEVGAIMNNRNYKQFNTVISEYINQNRKNFQEIYLITADWQQSDKSLRRFVEWWYYVKPFMNLPILRDIWVVRRMQKDDEWKPAMETYTWKDQNWDYVVKQRPIDEYIEWFWKPWIREYYDDLHKNIRDDEKYIDLDFKLLWKIINQKKELKEALSNENFIELNKKILPVKV